MIYYVVSKDIYMFSLSRLVTAKAVGKIPMHLGLSLPCAYAYFSNILFDLNTAGLVSGVLVHRCPDRFVK